TYDCSTAQTCRHRSALVRHLDEGVDDVVGDSEVQVRVETHDDGEDVERLPGGHLEPVDVVEVAPDPLVAGLAEVHLLQHVEHVPGGEHGADGAGDHGRPEHGQAQPVQRVVGADE